MSNKQHNTEIVILMVMTALVVAVMWLSLHMQRRSDGISERLPSSKSGNTEGGLLYYALCERLGYTLQRNDAVLDETVLESAGVLVLLQPYISLHPAERQQLRTWIASGGVLVTDQLDYLLDEIPAAISESIYTQSTHTGRIPKAIISTIPGNMDTGKLSRDVAKIVFKEKRYFSGQLFTDAEMLFRDASGVRIMEVPFGRGRIIGLADSSFLTNQCMIYHDNPILAVNLTAYALSRAETDTIVYDEYHYGSGQTKTGMGILTGSLFRTSPGWAILSIFAAGILWLILQGRRFGARLPLYQEKKRRSKLEFVDALGATYQAAGAHRFCLEMVDGWFRERLTAAMGLPLRASNAAIAAAAGQDNPDLADQVRRNLDESDALLKREKISERSLLKIIHQFKQIEGEVYREHSRGVSDHSTNRH